ncbi:MAG TPA: hypothetical protein VHA82_20910 [Ramlibacter sp.]|uniref:hypothetical protein n=1 Tax=Ramlibacter sp. TaxID=1917967 RepID=UPI002C6F15C9|nr:hypothetical protein [Ramlibacter sp.]HVZ46278.1 hypothetical protein [Ramlibacter sp.]
MKRKTLAAWLAFLGGPLGLHRFYLYGLGDLVGWALPIPTALGLYGIERVLQNGQDDVASWFLIPLAGFSIALGCLTAILYGLMAREQWNEKFNPSLARDHPAGGTNWFTIVAVALSLAFGAASLMFGLVYSFQKYFEYQVEEGRKISE